MYFSSTKTTINSRIHENQFMNIKNLIQYISLPNERSQVKGPSLLDTWSLQPWGVGLMHFHIVQKSTSITYDVAIELIGSSPKSSTLVFSLDGWDCGGCSHDC